MIQTKKVLIGRIIIGVLLALVLVAGIVVFTMPKNDTAVSAMECSVNPNVQFVLNSDNQVLSVICKNADGQVIVANTNFEGKTAEEAAYLFIKLATEAGYVDPDTTGEEVTVTFTSGASLDMTAVMARVRNMVNEYFDENGIIGRTVAQISNDITEFKNTLKAMGYTDAQLADKTAQEVMTMLHENAKYMKQIAFSLKQGYFDAIKAVRLQFSEMFELKDLIEGYEADLENSALTDEQKTAIRTLLQTAQTEIASLRTEYQAALTTAIEYFQEDSTTLLNQLRTQLQTRLNQYSTDLTTHKQNFNQNRNSIQQQIQAYRDALEA